MSSFPLMALFKLGVWGGVHIAHMCVPVVLCAGCTFDDYKRFVFLWSFVN